MWIGELAEWPNAAVLKTVRPHKGLGGSTPSLSASWEIIMNKKIEKIKKIVEKELSCSAHNLDHVMRVFNLCSHFIKKEKADKEVLLAAALLHDIARVKEDNDYSGKTDHAIEGVKMAAPILKKLGFPPKKIMHIQDCILSHRYRTGHTPKTIEAKILFDADKLDTLGAIGVARSFVWVGRNNAKIYTPAKDLKKYIQNNLGGKINGRIQDKTQHSPQIEFVTKIQFLINKLYTKHAKTIGRKRLIYYKNFLKRLEKEIKN